MESHRLLGDFLRARRELISPEEVGLPSGPRRRVPGLRREEVAVLAGISTEYYLRLEQGRDRHPSEQVLDAIASALRLDAESRAHALKLARSNPRRDRSMRKDSHRLEAVPKGVLALLDTINVPAFVMNRYRDVLAANPLATALEPTLRPGANRLLTLFTDPEAREYHPDWSANTASVVAQLRADTGGDANDSRFQALIGELSLKSERFRQLWARHDVRFAGTPTGTICHPEVGELTLWREKFAIAGGDSLVVVMYHADPGSRSADALALLASTLTTAIDRPPS